MNKQGKNKAESKKRLLELLGSSPDEPPVNLEEARMLAEMEGSPVLRKENIRLDNGCNKVCFSSEAQARACGNHRIKRSANVGRLRQYFCDTCKAWHLTSSFHR